MKKTNHRQTTGRIVESPHVKNLSREGSPRSKNVKEPALNPCSKLCRKPLGKITKSQVRKNHTAAEITVRKITQSQRSP